MLNAENATVVAKYKEVILDADYFTGKPAKMAGFYCGIIASHELTRNIYGYHRTDFNNVETAKKGAERYAIAPTGFKSYGYTQQQQDGNGVSAEAEETGTAKRLRFSKGAATVEAEEVEEQRTPPSADARQNSLRDGQTITVGGGESMLRYQLDESLGQQLEDWRQNLGKAGGTYNGKYFELGTTPDVFVKHGAPKADLIMYEDCIVKITGGKHDISLEEIAKLPSQLNDPILLFKGSVPNSFVALTELRTKQGHDVVVAVHINKHYGRSVVNKIASLHSRSNDFGKNKIQEYVKRQLDAGNLIDASAKKAPAWFTSRGLQLPKLVQTIIDANTKIPQNDSGVNNYSMRKSKKDSGKLRFAKGTTTVKAEEAEQTEQRTPSSADARLMGGSYLLDVDNKIVIIGGSFKNPVIHYVMVINAENATDAQEIKEVVFKHEHLKSLTSREASSGIGIYETYFGQKIVRGYDSKDFGYNAQAANLYARLPDGFRSYGYTQQQRDGSGVSAEAEETGTAKRLRFSKGTATVEAEEAEQTEQRTPPSADARLMGEHTARMDERFLYQELIRKPPMQVVTVDDTVQFDRSKPKARDAVVNDAIEECKKHSTVNENGNVLVYVKDIGRKVIMSKNGLRHGLDEKRFDKIVPLTLKAGELIQNAILLNEAVPKKKTVTNELILFALAKNKKRTLCG